MQDVCMTERSIAQYACHPLITIHKAGKLAMYKLGASTAKTLTC